VSSSYSIYLSLHHTDFTLEWCLMTQKTDTHPASYPLKHDHIHPNIFLAYDKARMTLRDRYSELGILAGKKHFSDLWARDFCFASLGALGLDDDQSVRRGLETLIEFISPDGQIPLRVGQKNFILKYMGFDAKIPEARYIDDKGHSVAVDNNSLFVILCEMYISKTNDATFVDTHYDAIKKAVMWNFTQDNDNDLLMEEGYFAGWADSVKKEGKVMYTNILHCQAIHSFSALCKRVSSEDESYFETLARDIKDRITGTFWNGSYYIDWVMPHYRQDSFSSDGNILAIIFGLASLEQARKIQRHMVESGLNHSFTTGTSYPEYEAHQVYGPFHFMNMADYHNGLEWLWIGCADVVAKWRCELHLEALAHLTKISHKIIEHNGVYEVYDKGKPVRRLFYKSEEWFAWSSGLFVWACHELGIST